MLTKTYTIISEIRLESRFLDSNIRMHLFNALQRTENTCTKKYGYTTKIISLNDIFESRINPADASNCFKLSYTFESIRPEVDEICEGTVLAIYGEGTIVDVTNLFQVLVVDGVYDEQHQTYSFNCNCKFSIGKPISFRLTDTSFRDGQFNCIGTHFCAI